MQVGYIKTTRRMRAGYGCNTGMEYVGYRYNVGIVGYAYNLGGVQVWYRWEGYRYSAGRVSAG